MPLQATSGAASYDAFGGGVPVEPVYIEQVFQNWLYTGASGAQSINNGIDLAGEGGLLWLKDRTNAGTYHYLEDSARGAAYSLSTNTTGAQQYYPNYVTSFNSNGFTIGAGQDNAGAAIASWTFRKQPKFFDVVTYTGNGGTLSVSHALASKPGCIIIKKTSGTGDWLVCTRKSDGNIYAMYLNTTAGQFYDGTEGSLWTSSAVSINWINSNVAGGFNDSGATYVMYVLAHNAGGFGLTGTDNVISCGTYTADGSGNATVNLGYEPQFVLDKITTVGDWRMFDNMRGIATGGVDARLLANDSQAEYNAYDFINLTSTGFTTRLSQPGDTYIYIAIRRGPMRTPTTGTSVFTPATRTGTSATANITSAGFPVDLALIGRRNTDGLVTSWDRLRGAPQRLITSSTNGESSSATGLTGFDSMTGFSLGNNNTVNDSTYNYVDWNFRRAPGFFDEVCYTGTGSATTQAHNLGVAPELMIVKNRGTGTNWAVYSSALGATKTLFLNLTNDPSTITSIWNDTAPTASVFTVGSAAATNTSANTYVNYLFASCPGVSKVTNFTGNGTSQTINCGFTSGARFVMIKATSTTGNWTVFDSARGISAGGDPALYLNSTAAEVTGVDAIDADSTGFIVNQEGTFNLNASGVQYLVLAIS